MSKEELINLLKEMNFNDRDIYISCEPVVSTYELISGDGIEVIQYETIITIKHAETTRKYKRNGNIKIYEDEEIESEVN